MKKFLLFFIIIPLLTKGQNRAEFWSKLTVILPVKHPWSVGADFQNRRQSDYRSDSKNMFQLPMMLGIRSWAFYGIKKQWQIVLSPIAFFQNKDLPDSLGNTNRSNELRQAIGLTQSTEIRKIKTKNRFLAEIRYTSLNTKENAIQFRYRLQNGITLSLKRNDDKKGLRYLLSNEFFLKGQRGLTCFDQDRLLNALQWKFVKSSVSLGYQYTVQKNSNDHIHRDQLFLLIDVTI